MSHNSFHVCVEKALDTSENGYGLGLDPLVDHPQIEVTVLDVTGGDRVPSGALEGADALRNEWIGGAAIDVFEDEPDVLGKPLLEQEDHLMTPHISGLTEDSVNRIGSLMCESIVNVLNGELLINVLTPEATDDAVPSENLSPSFQ